MTQIIPIRQGIALRELMCGKHERPSMPRDMRIELACIRTAERTAAACAVPGLDAHWFLRRWAEYSLPPIHSIRAEFGAIR